MFCDRNSMVFAEALKWSRLMFQLAWGVVDSYHPLAMMLRSPEVELSVMFDTLICLPVPFTDMFSVTLLWNAPSPGTRAEMSASVMSDGVIRPSNLIELRSMSPCALHR